MAEFQKVISDESLKELNLIKPAFFSINRFDSNKEKSNKSKKESSLKNICNLILHSFHNKEQNEIHLNDFARKIKVERRRIYDIINILEGLDIVVKKEKNLYIWQGFEKFKFNFVKLERYQKIERDRYPIFNFEKNKNFTSKKKSLTSLAILFLKKFYQKKTIFSIKEIIAEILNKDEKFLSDSSKTKKDTINPNLLNKEICPDKIKDLFLFPENTKEMKTENCLQNLNSKRTSKIKNNLNNVLVKKSKNNLIDIKPINIEESLKKDFQIGTKNKVRRIYDIINVFKGLGLISQTYDINHKKVFIWNGFDGIYDKLRITNNNSNHIFPIFDKQKNILRNINLQNNNENIGKEDFTSLITNKSFIVCPLVQYMDIFAIKKSLIL